MKDTYGVFCRQKNVYKRLDTGFNFKINQLYNYPSASVISFMNKNDSWKKEINKTNELLNHKQGHFDITEAYSRYANDSINKLWGRNSRSN